MFLCMFPGQRQAFVVKQFTRNRQPIQLGGEESPTLYNGALDSNLRRQIAVNANTGVSSVPASKHTKQLEKGKIIFA